VTRLEYLKLAIQSKVIENKSWFLKAFAIPVLTDKGNTGNELDLITKPDGLYVILDSGIEKITNYKQDQPLYSFQEVIDVDSTWLPTIEGKIKTKIGNLIINALILYPSFKGKFPYVNVPVTIPNIEKFLANTVVSDDEAGENDITVSEMIEAFDRFTFLTNLSNIINVAATEKTITPPPNIEKIKKELIKEYEGKLDDPVKLVELEHKLSKIDADYLADDPAAKNIFNKKSKTARQKMFLIYGDTMDFIKKSGTNAVIPSLSEGLLTDKENFPKYINDSRVGSFSRGDSTKLGGYTYKILQRSISGLTISPTECNTTRGIKRLVTKNIVNKLVKRYIKLGNKWILINNADEASKYIDKVVEMRTTLYCTSPKNTICYKCLNDSFKDFPDGVTNIVSNLSNTLLSLFMKLMHGNIRESTTLEIKDLLA
jgi:hypothetical protein